jgi:iduronate 2-sulfatase
MGYSIRDPRYRYAEWRDFKTGEVKARELYDHDNDPGETANVVDDAKHAEAVRRLAAQLREVVKEGARPLN